MRSLYTRQMFCRLVTCAFVAAIAVQPGFSQGSGGAGMRGCVIPVSDAGNVRYVFVEDNGHAMSELTADIPLKPFARKHVEVSGTQGDNGNLPFASHTISAGQNVKRASGGNCSDAESLVRGSAGPQAMAATSKSATDDAKSRKRLWIFLAIAVAAVIGVGAAAAAQQ